jgi:formate hydrogenlyase transcriptional activator
LRERREDIPLLVRYFVERLSRQMQKKIETVPSESMQALMTWHWPGNVRELENLIERAVILTTGSVLQVPLPDANVEMPSMAPQGPRALSAAGERERIVKILRETRGVLAGPEGAAIRLGMKRTTLQYKIKKLAIAQSEWWPAAAD